MCLGSPEDVSCLAFGFQPARLSRHAVSFVQIVVCLLLL